MWKHCMIDLLAKKDRLNALVFKLSSHVKPKIPRSIYFAVFESRLNQYISSTVGTKPC